MGHTVFSVAFLQALPLLCCLTDDIEEKNTMETAEIKNKNWNTAVFDIFCIMQTRKTAQS